MKEKLNEQQQKAVRHKSGPLLIIAGAGTGKTKVITHRIANIIENKWASPSEILALTFTEKAAGEMQERVDTLLPIGYEEPWISTFHSFCDRILRQESAYIGLDSSYKLMTPAESYILFRKYLFDLPLKKFRPLGNPSKFISDILKHFSRLQDEDVSPVQYIEYAKALPDKSKEEVEAKEEVLELAQTYKNFEEIKILNSKLDFGDLIITTLKLFRNKPNILEKYHKKFKYILVDEYQDTNHTQNVLVNLLALGKEVENAVQKDKDSANITVVGDDDQAIYKFRGAAISNILQFKKIYKNAQSIVLTTNYRSNQDILDCAYRLIKNNDPYRLEVTENINKKLISATGKGGDGVRLIVESTSSAEAERICKEILEITGRSRELNTEFDEKGQGSFEGQENIYKLNDIAILVRANNHADEIINNLKYFNIQYKLGGSRSLYSRAEIQVLISFLKTVADYTDAVSMFNVLSMDEWKLSAREVVDIVRYSRKSRASIFETLEGIVKEKFEGKLSNQSKASINLMMSIYSKAMKMLKDGRSAGEILFMFFEKCGLKEKYMKDESGKYIFAGENVTRYFEMLNSFWQNNRSTNLYEYLDYLEYSVEVGEGPTVDSALMDEMDAVSILTIHSAKGLEFPVVFVANLVNDRFPSRDRSDSIGMPEPLIKELLPVGGEESEHLMEERRLCYVAFTRAKERLYLTAANYYATGKRKKKPSIFLFESMKEGFEEEFENHDVVKKGLGDIVVLGGKDNLDYQKLGLKPNNEFSYSQLHTYENCPIQYKYEYVLGLPTQPSGALSFGNTVHNTLKQIYEQLILSKIGLKGFIDPVTEEKAIEYFKNNWIGIGYDDKKHEMKRYEEGQKLVKRYIQEVFSPKENPLKLEESFKFVINDFKVKGRIDRIDLIGEEDGKKVVDIIDYKTGKEKSKSEAQKEWQLQLYVHVVETTMNMKVNKASYIFVEHGKRVDVDIDRKKIQKVLNHINEIVEKIRAGDFSLPSGHECKYCGFKDICDNSII